MEVSIRYLIGQYWSNPIFPDKIVSEVLNTKKYFTFSWKFVFDPWKDNILDPGKDNIDQTVLSLRQKVLEMLENYKKEPCVVFMKVNQIFLRG